MLLRCDHHLGLLRLGRGDLDILGLFGGLAAYLLGDNLLLRRIHSLGWRLSLAFAG